MRGYQDVRIAPGLSPSGLYWRCAITAAPNVGPDMTVTNPGLPTALYGSGQGRRYFDWDDAAHATPSRLADLFIARFPEVVAAGRGSGRAYAGWYLEMLHRTYPDDLPIAYADWDLPAGVLSTVKGGVQIALPPPAMGSEPGFTA